MKHEDGYCDACGAALGETWLTLSGKEFCRPCAVGGSKPAIRIAAKPEARDDGR
jgi:hypothetical protein